MLSPQTTDEFFHVVVSFAPCSLLVLSYLIFYRVTAGWGIFQHGYKRHMTLDKLCAILYMAWEVWFIYTRFDVAAHVPMFGLSPFPPHQTLIRWAEDMQRKLYFSTGKGKCPYDGLGFDNLMGKEIIC